MAGLYKRGNIWWARAQRDGREFRQSLKTSNKRLAENRLQEWLRQIEAQQWGDRPRIALQQAMRHFAQTHMTSLKMQSARRYAVSMKWIDERLGDKYLDQIDRAALSDFETWRRSMGVKPPTVRRDLMCLSAILSSCEDADWINEGANPVPAYLRRRAKRGLKEAPPRTRYLQAPEEQKLLKHASPAVYGAICLAIDTGLREQELFTLTWPQINFAQGIITTTNNTKSKRSRIVPMPERSAQILAQMKKKNFDNVSSLFVFCHSTGKRIISMKKGFRAAVTRAGLLDVRWHDLRRTAGCKWLQDQGKRLEDVQILLGHASITTTEKAYAFLDNERVAREVAAQKPAQEMRTK